MKQQPKSPRKRLSKRRLPILGSPTTLPKECYVIAQGFGSLRRKKWRIGRVLRLGKHTFDVEFRDEEIGELYFWTFSTHSGIRTCDVGNESGWRVPLEDVGLAESPNAKVVVTGKRDSGLKKVHEEVEHLSEQETITYQMWVIGGASNPQRDFYLKAFRTVVVSTERDRMNNPKVVKVREHAAVIPLSKVQEILYQFKETSNV